jgi:uncharacterized protein
MTHLPTLSHELNALKALSLNILDAADEVSKVDVVTDDVVLPLKTIRRDIAGHKPVETSGMIRFVVSPEAQLVPDLAQKLPGRGLWIKADRQSLQLAVSKNLFAKAAKRHIKPDAGLVDRVHGLLRQRCLAILGLMRRQGIIISGFEKVAEALRLGTSHWLIEATDSAQDGRTKLIRLGMAVNPSLNICGVFNNEELSLALGLENAIHLAIPAARNHQSWSPEIKRLSGFEPLVPLTWSLSGRSGSGRSGSEPYGPPI